MTPRFHTASTQSGPWHLGCKARRRMGNIVFEHSICQLLSCPMTTYAFTSLLDASKIEALRSAIDICVDREILDGKSDALHDRWWRGGDIYEVKQWLDVHARRSNEQSYRLDLDTTKYIAVNNVIDEFAAWCLRELNAGHYGQFENWLSSLISIRDELNQSARQTSGSVVDAAGNTSIWFRK